MSYDREMVHSVSARSCSRLARSSYMESSQLVSVRRDSEVRVQNDGVFAQGVSQRRQTR